MADPYRDENDSLRAENERLRAALARRRGVRRGVTVGLVGLDFAAILALRPWLNGGSDAKFWAALLIVVSLAIGAIVSGALSGSR